MPYVRQKTWLPMAPRIAGLSLKESPWGFGAKRGMADVANCPSMEQMLGITDPNDPCQAANVLPLSSATVSGQPTSPSTLLPSVQTLEQGLTPSQIAAAGGGAPTTSLATWFSQNQTVVLAVGGILFVLALAKGLSK